MNLTLHNHLYTDIQILWGSYSNSRPALQLFTAQGEVLAKASVNVPEVAIDDPTIIFIKDYSENEGILAFLIEHEIVVNTGLTIPSGYVILNVCKIHPKQLAELKTQEERKKQ